MFKFVWKPSQPIGDHPLWPCPLRVVSNFVRRSYTNYNKSTDSHPVAASVAIFILVLDKTAQCPGATEVSRATKTRFAGIEGVRQRGQHSNSLEVSGKRIYRSACWHLTSWSSKAHSTIMQDVITRTRRNFRTHWIGLAGHKLDRWWHPRSPEMPRLPILHSRCFRLEEKLQLFPCFSFLTRGIVAAMERRRRSITLCGLLQLWWEPLDSTVSVVPFLLFMIFPFDLHQLGMGQNWVPQ